MSVGAKTLARVARLIGAGEVTSCVAGQYQVRGGDFLPCRLSSDEILGRILDALAKKFRNIELYYSSANGGWHVELIDFDSATDISGPTRQDRLDAMLELISVLPEEVL